MFPFSVTRKLASSPQLQPQPGGQSGCELIAFDAEQLNVFSAEVRYCEPHWHPAPELILVLSGSFSIAISQDTHQLAAGEMLYINAEEVHSLEAHATASSLLTVQFSLGLFNKTHPVPRLEYRSMRSSLTPSDSHVYRALASLVAHLIQQASPFSRIAAVYLLLDALEKAGSPALQSQIHARDVVMIKDCIEFINLHYEEDLTLGQLAEQAGVSYHHFSRTFKKVSNHNFKEYLTLIRTNKARQLLKDTHIPITEISQICGFREHKHLIFAFNKYCSMTPTDFRKRYLSSLNVPQPEMTEDCRCLPLNEALLKQLNSLSGHPCPQQQSQKTVTR